MWLRSQASIWSSVGCSKGVSVGLNSADGFSFPLPFFLPPSSPPSLPFTWISGEVTTPYSLGMRFRSWYSSHGNALVFGNSFRKSCPLQSPSKGMGKYQKRKWASTREKVRLFSLRATISGEAGLVFMPTASKVSCTDWTTLGTASSHLLSPCSFGPLAEGQQGGGCLT